MDTMNEFIGPLSESKQSKEELIKSGVLDFWISFTVKFVDKDGNLPNDVQMSAVSTIFHYIYRFYIWNMVSLSDTSRR